MSRLVPRFMPLAGENADLVEACHGMILLLPAQIICKGRRILFGCPLSGHDRANPEAAVGRYALRIFGDVSGLPKALALGYSRVASPGRMPQRRLHPLGCGEGP